MSDLLIVQRMATTETTVQGVKPTLGEFNFTMP